MATISKRGKEQWQAKVRKKGFSTQTKTFTTKAQAEKWARLVESEMDRGVFLSTNEAENTLLQELFDRYEKEVLPLKKSQQDMKSRLKTLSLALGHLSAAALTPLVVKEYRDYRLEEVSSGSVRKELSLLSRVITVTQREWDIFLPRGNPVESISKPKADKARERRLEKTEEAQLLKAARQYGGEISEIISFAIETGMRRTEIALLIWKNIDLNKKTAKLVDTKNGENRAVPLSPLALMPLESLPRNINGFVFSMRPDSISQAFERVCHRVKIEDLRFHDLRHEATSRFFEKGLNIMEVAAITGHKDLGMLKRYTDLRAEDLAERLG